MVNNTSKIERIG